jgi:hypothetical protein
MMGIIDRYYHHGHYVAVDSALKGKHREHCLCFRCPRFKPDAPENCDVAELLFRIDVLFGLVTPVWECAKYPVQDEEITTPDEEEP